MADANPFAKMADRLELQIKRFEIERAVMPSATRISGRARGMAPVVTGALRDSVFARVSVRGMGRVKGSLRATVTIRARTRYWAMVQHPYLQDAATAADEEAMREAIATAIDNMVRSSL